MFANFELYSAGLVRHEEKRRSAARSGQACLPCHQAKKKCNEQQPECARCSSKGIPCSWPPSKSTTTPRASTASRSRRCTTTISSPESASPSPSPSASSAASPATSPLPRSSAAGPLVRSLNAFPALPHVGGISESYLGDLIQSSNRILHGAYFDDAYSLLPLSLAVLAESPPYVHMWISLAAMSIAQQQPPSADSHTNPWLREALRHHGTALQALAKHVSVSSPHPPEDWALCTMLLMHMFEKFGSPDHPPSFAHLVAARTLFMQRFAGRPPATVHEVLQVESLVYRIAITSTFHTSCHTHYRWVSDLVALCESCRVDCSMWRHSLWISLPLFIFDTIFKLSLLLRRWPLSPSGLAQLDSLERNLLRSNTQQQQLVLAWGNTTRQESIAEQSHSALELYICACLIQVAKLRIGKGAPKCNHERDVSAPGFKIIDRLTASGFASPVLLWPSIILGLSADNASDRETITVYISTLEPYSGLRATTSVLRLLAFAWRESEANGGTNVLFHPELLTHIFI